MARKYCLKPCERCGREIAASRYQVHMRLHHAPPCSLCKGTGRVAPHVLPFELTCDRCDGTGKKTRCDCGSTWPCTKTVPKPGLNARKRPYSRKRVPCPLRDDGMTRVVMVDDVRHVQGCLLDVPLVDIDRAGRMLRAMAKRKTDAKCAVAYLRVSTEDQNLGPEAQRAAIEAWATREGVSVVSWHVDHGVSGAAPLDKRKALVEALADLRAQRAGVLVVAKRDRLARDIVAGAMVEKLAADVGARVLSSAGEGSTGDDPSSVLLRRIVDAFAEHERLLIAMRTRQALAAKKARGELTGKPPFGTKVSDDGRTLVEDEHEARVLATVRELRAERRSLREVVRELGARGLVGRTGQPYALAQVQRIAKLVA